MPSWWWIVFALLLHRARSKLWGYNLWPQLHPKKSVTYDNSAIQHWSAMMSCGVFQMNTEIDTIFTMQFREAVEILKCTLKTAFPENRYSLLSTKGSHQVEDILRSARKISLRLQTGFFSSWLVVTIALVKDGSNDCYGMSELGEIWTGKGWPIKNTSKSMDFKKSSRAWQLINIGIYFMSSIC